MACDGAGAPPKRVFAGLLRGFYSVGLDCGILLRLGKVLVRCVRLLDSQFHHPLLLEAAHAYGRGLARTMPNFAQSTSEERTVAYIIYTLI